MRRTTARRVVQAFAVERLLSFLDKFIDIAMILALILWGPIVCFGVGVVLSLIFCICVLEMELRFRATGVEHLKEWAYTNAETGRGFRAAMARWLSNRLKSVLRIMMRSYWLMLLVGSVVYLESDYVTLLLKKQGEGRGSIFLRVMLPSVVWGIGIWTLIFWGSLQFALWLWFDMTGCMPTECLAQDGWQPILTVLYYVEDLFRSFA